MATMYNPMINSSVMPNLNQMGKFYGNQHPHVNFKLQQHYSFNLQQQRRYQHQQNLYRQQRRYQNQQNLYRQHHHYRPLYCYRRHYHYHNNEQQDLQHLFYDGEYMMVNGSNALAVAKTTFITIPESATRVSSSPLNNAQTLHMPQGTFHISATGLVLCKIPERHYDMPYPAYKVNKQFK